MDSQIDDIDVFLKDYEPYFRRLSSGKIECVLNGHQLKPDAELLRNLVNGKKFQMLKQLEQGFEEIKQFEPFLIRSKNFKDKVYCTLTGQLIGVGLAHAYQHCEGQRFKKRKEKYLAKELELVPEPEINDVLKQAVAQEELEAGLQSMEITDQQTQKLNPKRNRHRSKQSLPNKKKPKLESSFSDTN